MSPVISFDLVSFVRYRDLQKITREGSLACSGARNPNYVPKKRETNTDQFTFDEIAPTEGIEISICRRRWT